ncbi:PREDICTED: uncharacterized protein LOC109169374 [Ipomoea nil]|uniref:uncharacterized protein LOC109169374 n=1 Tax=Ipomoea nil TaxID=35883 RepID=UPI000901FB38|nr:PREDICTED: uncharacterized protein LOC109169374 [Ipomoea nil]
MANEQNPPVPAADSASAGGSAAIAAIPEPRHTNNLHQAHHLVSIKLSSVNYLFWKAQLVPFLRGQSLFGYVDGTSVCPPEYVTTATEATVRTVNLLLVVWVQQDQSILSMLISSMADDVLYLAIGHLTSRSLWMAIETALGSTSRARSLSLLTQLQSLHQGDALPAVYLGKAQVLVEQLA